MKFGQHTRLAKARKSIKRLEAKEEEMIRFENPERYYLLKELEEEGKISKLDVDDFNDSTFVDKLMRKCNR